MNKAPLLAGLPVLSGMLTASAADELKAFPPAEKGMVRHVLQLPNQDDASAFKAEWIVGKTLMRQ